MQRIKQQGVQRRRAGFVIGGERIGGIDEWHDVTLGAQIVGTATEAVYSPRVQKNIAVGMIATHVAGDEKGLEIRIDGERRAVSIHELPFC